MKKIYIKFKNQHGSVTLFVLISMLFFVTLLLSLFVNTQNKLIEQQKEIKQIQSEYTSSDMEQIYKKTLKRPQDFLLIAGDRITANESTSPYVNYTDKNGSTILCRVLYDVNDANTGIQIVSQEPISPLSLGKDDANYTIGSDYEKAKSSYNNVIARLNQYAIDTYLNPRLSPSNGARCVGSNPVTPNNESEIYVLPDNLKSNYSESAQELIANNFKDTDENYKSDEARLKAIGACGFTNSEDVSFSYYWFASRYIYANSEYMTSIIRIITPDGNLVNSTICRIETNASKLGYGRTYGFRPVFTLKSNVIITDGNGTETSPYILSSI